ncbi:NACHT domain-containing protein [Flavobacterium sp. ZS1P14]|uniref:NACHT domain-containing protein n=1 Tax=Flavobacterium sp. ZS1P14 TaxID=3401729 RepID=UPI003AAAE993
MWNSFNTYHLSPENAFETMNNQLFERYLKREYNNELIKFRVINGSGGDGGIEAYGELYNNTIVAVQSKWFRNSLGDNQINQIRNSIVTALSLRPSILQYIICIPRDINSLKIGKGKKPIKNTEESRIDELINEIKKVNKGLKITWWFQNEILGEIMKPENEGVHKYWFEKEILFFSNLKDKFAYQKTNSWLRERYVPNLNTSGIIKNQISKLQFTEPFRKSLLINFFKINLEIETFLKQSIQFNEYSKENDFYENLSAINKYLLNIKKSNLLIQKDLGLGIQPNLHILTFIGDFNIIEELEEVEAMLKLTNPNNLQKTIYDNFIYKLNLIKHVLLGDYYKLLKQLEGVNVMLVLGNPGTGKTHGLAFEVARYLDDESPAILIRAFGKNSKNWNTVLLDELELNGWNNNEIFSALETLALRNDVKKATRLKPGEEPNFENTKVLICIDGLDEDVNNFNRWYDRISETIEICKKYPRIKFVFSARKYFYNNSKIIKNDELEITELPREGDVSVETVLNDYLVEYNIKIENLSLLRGLDSLFALHLFCNEYQGSELNDNSKIELATNSLLNKKIERINEEFKSSLNKKLTTDSNPVADALIQISELFYQKSEISHDELRNEIDQCLLKYLDNSDVELLIQFLSENGIVAKYQREVKKGIIKKYTPYYSITFQSILEIIISDKICETILNGSLNQIPDNLFEYMAMPIDLNPIEYQRKHGKYPNEKIIQDIVNKVFNESEKLIGENNFLTNGFDAEEIFLMQLEALINAPYNLALKYENWVTNLLVNDYEKRIIILKELIYPSANNENSPFNARYLHNILSNFKSTFERDKFWSGLDSHEKSLNSNYNYWDLNSLLNSYKTFSEFEKYDGIVLIYAWGLTTIDQKLREELRIKITEWALLIPDEFLKLLDLLYYCGDPQIQEDFASITLGIASNCKNKDAILQIAKWTVKNIFERLEENRNVIVRYGFRAIIERAYQFGLIGINNLKKARPKKNKTFKFLPLDLDYLKKPKEEFYPIVHDLAWYVIKRGYEDFLSYSSGFNNYSNVKKPNETEKFLKKYGKNIENEYDISPRGFAMSVSIAFIKSLGFDRTKGNGFTDASGGSKSKVFTYEEKYTWLAVNNLKGYLSDYLPYSDDIENAKWIDDYSQITEIHNPTEDFSKKFELFIDNMFNPKSWIIKEEISPDLKKGVELSTEIKKIVSIEPKLDFNKWVFTNENDFEDFKENGLVAYNYTSLYNSSKTIISSIRLQACLIKESDFEELKKFVSLNSKKSHILNGALDFYSYPKTDTYSNPSDIIWMDWIGEDENEIFFDGEKVFYPSLTRVTKVNVDGEKQLYIPSKILRKNLDITELEGDRLINSKNKTVGIFHNVDSDNFQEGQDLIILNKSLLETNLKKNGLKSFWFGSFFIKKNPHNEDINEIEYTQRYRKYLLWEENGNIKNIEFWNGKFSNQL